MATPTLAPRVRFKTPAVCHKSQPPPPLLLAGTYPPDLHGFVKWVDLDPGNEARLSSTVDLVAVANGGHYEGRTPEETNYIVCKLDRHLITKLWTLEMIIHGLRVPPEDFQFAPFAIDLEKPFDTGFQNLVTIPGRDFRQAQLAF